VYWCIAAYMTCLWNTWPAASNTCLTSQHADICVRQQYHNYRTCHPLFNTWRPSVPCRRCTRLERSSALSLICTVFSNLQTIFKETYSITVFIYSLSVLNLMYSAPEGVVCDSVTLISSFMMMMMMMIVLKSMPME